MKTEPVDKYMSDGKVSPPNGEAGPSNGTVHITTYSNHEMEIVKQGLSAVKEVLLGPDMEAKNRLLFFLDRFLDPWFGYELPDRGEIIDLLQTVVISQNSISVKEAALQLLCDYAWPPFLLLEKNFDAIEAELKPEAGYAIHMDREIENEL